MVAITNTDGLATEDWKPSDKKEGMMSKSHY